MAARYKKIATTAAVAVGTVAAALALAGPASADSATTNQSGRGTPIPNGQFFAPIDKAAPAPHF